jgi:hypothetical protein
LKNPYTIGLKFESFFFIFHLVFDFRIRTALQTLY